MMMLALPALAESQQMAPADYLRTIQDAQSQFAVGDWKAATDAYTRAVGANPHVEGSGFLLGLARMKGGDARGAVPALDCRTPVRSA